MEIGSLLDNRYRISEILGKGGMGAVYKGIDESLGVPIAVKENLFSDEEYARQFRREAIILANLRHPNLPRVTDHLVIENQGQYLVMDFIEGEDLRQRLDRLGIIPEEEAMLMGIAISDALAYLHTLNPPVLHRDIKPGNLKVSPSGEVYLVDFGLAKIVKGSGKTTLGAQGLTPGFSPPEQYGGARTDARSDIYSLGATIYVALTGSSPEDGLARMMGQSELTPIAARNPKVSKQFTKVVEKAIEVQPEDRFQRAEVFKQALIEANDTVTRKVAKGGITIAPPPLDASDLQTEPVSPSSSQVEASVQKLEAKKGVSKLQISIFAILVLAILTVGAFLFFPNLSERIFGGADGTSTEAVAQASITPWQPTEALETGPALTEPALIEATFTQEIIEEPTPTTAPTLGPTPTGGGGKIAFASDRTGIPQIWIMNVDGTGLDQVTDEVAGACQPDWSPDGNRLVFISPCSNDTDTYPGSSMFVINIDGSEFTPLASFPGGDYDPAWSPDGSKIAFTTLRDSRRPQIWVLDLETNTASSLSDSITNDFNPAWSPDGDSIVFVTTRIGPTQIWTMDASGRPWNLFSRSDSLINVYPAWSPDGEVILFTQSDPSGGLTWLSAAAWTGGGTNQAYDEFLVITDNSIRVRNPMREADYSPDGVWLTFVNNPEGINHDIYIMTSNGARMLQLTDDPANDFDPAWQPFNP
ncbi:MAG: protein kinase [Chloroflexi bacterium]|nr:protein kinase [Chloroflexota bacterium]